MRLPQRADGRGVEIGPSDLLGWRTCPARAKLGRRRLEGRPAPEANSPAAAYGTAVHTVIERLDEGDTIDEAVQHAFSQAPEWLEPSDVTRLHEDAEKYLSREILGVRTLLNEGDISIPLFEHPTEGQVWLRGRIDRLYQSLEDPGHLIQVDYKSSRHAMSEEEVHKDTKTWTYNLLVVEWFRDLYPEVEQVHLEQKYDQLRYGELLTRKSDEQRAAIKRWLIVAVTAMIADEEEAPRFNEYCSWCPLLTSCEVVRYELTDWAQTRIAALMPRGKRLNKDGSVSKRPGPVELDPERLGEYVELLPDVKRAGQVLERFEKEVTAVLKEMPESELERYGKRKSERSIKRFSASAKREIIELVGLGTFLAICDLPLAAVERFFEDDRETMDKIASLAERQPAYTVVQDA